MEKSDKVLLDFYLSGFNDYLDGEFSYAKNLYPTLQQKAYKLGGLHAQVGDDLRSVDYLSDKEILEEIKK